MEQQPVVHKSVFNWSGGKDSALALYHHLNEPGFEVCGLLTTVNASNKRIAMHGVPEVLVDEQARALGMPLLTIHLPENPSMGEYNRLMEAILSKYRSGGVTHAVFGDIFLEDLKQYREMQLEKVGMKARFPIWGRDTSGLILEFLDLGFKTMVVSVNASLLDQSFCGRVIDHHFLKDLPENVDPCGENGEFHTFVFDGPIFKRPVPFKTGQKVYKTYPAPTRAGEEIGFWFCDLFP